MTYGERFTLRFVGALAMCIYFSGFVATGVALDKVYGSNMLMHAPPALVWPIWVPEYILETHIEKALK